MKKILEIRHYLLNREPPISQHSALWLNTLAWSALLLMSASLYRHYLNWNFDDSYIVFRIVNNIIGGNGWAYNASEAYNASTSALNTILVAIIAKLFSVDVPYAAHLVGTFGIFLAGASIFMLVRERAALGVAVISALMIMYLMGKNLTWGLETHLFCGTLLLFCYLEHRKANTWWLVPVLVLLRPDALLILMFKVAYELLLGRSIIKGLLTVSVVLMPWVIFSLSHFHQVFPDTLSNKMWQGRSGFWGTGYIYFKGLLIHLWQNKIFIFSSPLIFWGVYRIIKSYTAFCFFLLFIAAQQSAYVLLNVPTYHWYFAALDLCLSFLLIIGLVEASLLLISKYGYLREFLSREIDISFGLTLACILFSFYFLGREQEAADGRDLSYLKLSAAINGSNISPGAVAALEVGTIGYRVNRPIVDLVSLTSKNPEFLTGKNNDLFFKLAPQLVVVHHPIWPMERAIFEDPRFEELYSLVSVVKDTAIPTKYFVLNESSAEKRDEIINSSKQKAIQDFKLVTSNIILGPNIGCNTDTFSYLPVDYSNSLTVHKAQKGDVNVDGWIYDRVTNTPLAQPYVLLKSTSSDQLQLAKAKAYERPDVAKAFVQDSILKSGFRAVINITSLPVGDYELFIARQNPDSTFEVCDKVIKFTLVD